MATEKELADRLEALKRHLRELSSDAPKAALDNSDARLVKPPEFEGHPAHYNDQAGRWLPGEGWR